MTNDPQQTWSEYYQRIRRRRIREAQMVSAQMTVAGLDDATILALDFRHFSRDEYMR